MLCRRGNAALHGWLRRNSAHSLPSFLETLEPRTLLTAVIPCPAAPSAPSPRPSLLVVNTLADPQAWNPADAVLSLREAIARAAATPEADLIRFAPSLFVAGPATLTLEGPAFTLSGQITLAGPGQNLLTLDGASSLGRIGRILTIAENATAAVSGLTLAGGNLLVTGGDSFGGAVSNSGHLTLVDTTLAASQAATGGAIASGFSSSADTPISLDLLRCTITQNSAAVHGGGLFVLRGAVSVVNTTFAANTADLGAGVFFWHDAPARIAGSTFTDNRANSGGAVYSRSQLTIARTAFTANSASRGGAVVIDNAPLALSESTFTDNLGWQGGALYSAWPGSALDITRSRFLRNSAVTGGAIALFGGSLTLCNDTLVENTADSGGAIAADAESAAIDILLARTVLTRNTARLGGALYAATLAGSLTLALNHTTLTANTAQDGGALYATGQRGITLNLANTAITRNAATANGGGLYLASIHTDGAWSNTSITANTAGLNGGGIYCYIPCASHVAWTGGSLSRNTAGANGGGLYLSIISSPWDHGGAQWALSGLTILANAAQTNGGALYTRAYNFDSSYITLLNLTLASCTLLGNSAGTDGGALYNFTCKYSRTLLQFANTFLLANTAGRDGGAISLDVEETAPADTTTLALTNTAILFNTAALHGGGLSLDAFGSQLIADPATVITDNIAPLGNNIWLHP